MIKATLPTAALERGLAGEVRKRKLKDVCVHGSRRRKRGRGHTVMRDARIGSRR